MAYTQKVMRSANWGFVLQSCWCVMVSFTLPLPGEDPDLEALCEVITTDDQVCVLKA